MTNPSAAEQQHAQPQQVQDQQITVQDSEDVSAIAEAVKQHISAIEESAIDDQDAEALLASLYYDAGTMTSLNPTAEVCLIFLCMPQPVLFFLVMF